MKNATCLFAIALSLVSISHAQLTVTEENFHGKNCFKVTTPWATLYYEDHYGSSGFKGVLDNDGNDWLQAGYGWGNNAGYRGFPNATDGDFGHAQRNSNSTNTITKQDFDHIIINSYNSKMEFNYHFFPSHGAIEVVKAEDEYCFLWEGTNGGSVNDDDFFYTSDGTKRTARSERNTIGDFPDEWMYFGDPDRDVMFLHGKRPDDEINDENWRRLSTFELYSFGRGDKNDGWRRRLTGTDNYYVFTFVDASMAHAEVEQTITDMFAKPFEPLAEVTGVAIRKAETRMPINGSLTVNAARFPKEGAISWSCPDGAAVQAIDDTSAAVTAPATAGTIRIVATFMDDADTLSLEVFDPAQLHLKINAGGGAYEDWEAGADYILDGEQYSFGFDTDVSQTANPAPADIYKTVHHMDHSYDIDVANGEYLVRIHFVNNGSGRLMNYAIEGQPVLQDFTVTEEAGGQEIALAKEFQVTVSDGNGLQIEATKGSGNDVFEAGVEVIAQGTIGTAFDRVPATARHAAVSIQRSGATIAVRTPAHNATVQLVSLDGTIVASSAVVAGTARLTAPSTGAYLLRIDNRVHRIMHVR
jgi:hypothetical protein